MAKLFPIADAQGIAKVKELYLNRVGRTLSDEEAAEVLTLVMRFIYLTSGACFDMDSTPENPKKTKAA